MRESKKCIQSFLKKECSHIKTDAEESGNKYGGKLIKHISLKVVDHLFNSQELNKTVQNVSKTFMI